MCISRRRRANPICCRPWRLEKGREWKGHARPECSSRSDNNYRSSSTTPCRLSEPLSFRLPSSGVVQRQRRSRSAVRHGPGICSEEGISRGRPVLLSYPGNPWPLAYVPNSLAGQSGSLRMDPLQLPMLLDRWDKPCYSQCDLGCPPSVRIIFSV